MNDKELIKRALDGEVIGGGSRQISLLIQQREELLDLVHHMWIHDGYRSNGRSQMTTELKEIYDSAISREMK